MTALALDLSYDVFHAGFTDSGTGPEAHRLRISVCEGRQLSDPSVTFGVARAMALRDLILAAEDCSCDNWDGYGAKAVDWDSVQRARALLDLLPTVAPLPEVGVDPDGEVALEWYEAPGWSLSVSVGRNGVLSYAGLFGGDTTHGTERFQDEIPEMISRLLARLLQRGRPWR